MAIAFNAILASSGYSKTIGFTFAHTTAGRVDITYDGTNYYGTSALNFAP